MMCDSDCTPFRTCSNAPSFIILFPLRADNRVTNTHYTMLVRVKSPLAARKSHNSHTLRFCRAVAVLAIIKLNKKLKIIGPSRSFSCKPLFEYFTFRFLSITEDLDL